MGILLATEKWYFYNSQGEKLMDGVFTSFPPIIFSCPLIPLLTGQKHEQKNKKTKQKKKHEQTVNLKQQQQQSRDKQFLRGRNPLCPPLPGKAIKLFFSTKKKKKTQSSQQDLFWQFFFLIDSCSWLRFLFFKINLFIFGCVGSLLLRGGFL